MSEAVMAKPDYGNWVSKRLIYVFGLAGLVLFVASYLFLPLVILSLLAFIIAAYFAYSRHLFSPEGGNVQAQIIDLALAHVDWDGQGEALDIGCGNGALAVKLARKYPGARVTGADYWGANWEYSKGTCDTNARLEGVGDRVTFQKASASALPFADGQFDAVVSNLTFHEVRDAKDKREVIREALRVVKKGGKFTFQDLFLMRPTYGDPEELVKTIKSWGIEKVEFIDTHGAAFIPGALKLPFMVGTIGIIRGEK
jgi:cyclopropane fatty-acyl-phospholipid synthase-like methyltransferase